MEIPFFFMLYNHYNKRINKRYTKCQLVSNLYTEHLVSFFARNENSLLSLSIIYPITHLFNSIDSRHNIREQWRLNQSNINVQHRCSKTEDLLSERYQNTVIYTPLCYFNSASAFFFFLTSKSTEIES